MKRHAFFRRRHNVIIFIISFALNHGTQAFSPVISPTISHRSYFGLRFLSIPTQTLNQSLLPPIYPSTRSHHAVSKLFHSDIVAETTNTDRTFTDELVTVSSTSSLILIDFAFRKLLKSLNISFPSSLAGCGALLAALLAACAIKEEWGDFLYGLLAPGAGLLAKWLPVCLVPNLVLLPLAQSIGSGVEVSVPFRMALCSDFLLTRSAKKDSISYCLSLIDLSVLFIFRTQR